MITEEQKWEIVDLRAKGFSYQKISDKLGISKPTLINATKKLFHEIENAIQIEQDFQMEKYRLNRLSQLKILGNINQKIEEEIEKRDFSDIPTNKLIELALRVSDVAKLIHPFGIELKKENDILNSPLSSFSLDTWQIK